MCQPGVRLGTCVHGPAATCCVAGWEERRRGEQKSRLWKEDVLGRNSLVAEAWLGRVPNVVAGTWCLGLRRAGNLVTKCSRAPLTDSVSFPAASSAMALPVLTQPASAPCTKPSIASPAQTPKKTEKVITERCKLHCLFLVFLNIPVVYEQMSPVLCNGRSNCAGTCIGARGEQEKVRTS